MKLASLRAGGRDGTLVVVSADLSRARTVPAVAATLQAALENWSVVEPELAAVYGSVSESAQPDDIALDVDELASPLPRTHQFLDGSVYLHHMEKARAARGAAMPPNFRTDPLVYQGPGDAFAGPTEPLRIPSADLELDYEAEIAVVLDDVPMGVAESDAASHVRLVMLLNDYTLRALTRTELPKGFGFLQAKPTSSFSPVALTPDELGAAWDGERFHLRVSSGVNGHEFGRPDAGQDMFFSYPQLIAHAARTRSLGAGTILGAGSISNIDPAAGHGCVAEARVAEAAAGAMATTPFLSFGDRVRIEALDVDGHSIFGAIDQKIVPAEAC